MQFGELSAKARRERVREAVDGLLRQADLPLPSAQLIKLTVAFLDAKEEANWIARAVVDLAKEHPSARQTGEVFYKYGREMRRWEWLPLHKRPSTRPSSEELERRRRKIAALEAEDEWTVHPEPAKDDEEFLDG